MLDSVVIPLFSRSRRLACSGALLLGIVALVAVELLLHLDAFCFGLFILGVLEEKLVGRRLGARLTLCFPELERGETRASTTREVDSCAERSELEGAEVDADAFVFLERLDLEELAAEEAAASSAGLDRLMPGILIWFAVVGEQRRPVAMNKRKGGRSRS